MLQSIENFFDCRKQSGLPVSAGLANVFEIGDYLSSIRSLSATFPSPTSSSASTEGIPGRSNVARSFLHPIGKDWQQSLREDRDALILAEAHVLADALGFVEDYCSAHPTDARERITSCGIVQGHMAAAPKRGARRQRSDQAQVVPQGAQGARARP